PLSVAVAGLFIIVDLSFVSANMVKVFEGGWVPLVVGAALYFAMSTWRWGPTALTPKLERDTLPLGHLIAQAHSKARGPGTAVYLTSRIDVVPVPLLHNLKHNKVLHERIVLLHVVTRRIPRVPPDKRIEVVHLGDNFHSVVAYYGFMQNPNVPRTKFAPQNHPLQIIRGHASQRSGGDGIFPHSGEPSDRARQSGGDLSTACSTHDECERDGIHQ